MDATLGLPSEDLQSDIFSSEEVKARVEQAYNCKVAAVLPHSDEMMALASSDIFALRYPDHPVTGILGRATALMLG